MRQLRNQRGDTLVEVTISCAILAVVLLISFNLASFAFRVGQAAKVRTQGSQLAQEQAEALRAYRDNHPWVSSSPTISCDAAGTGFQLLATGGFPCSVGGANPYHFEHVGTIWHWVGGIYDNPLLNGQESDFHITIVNNGIVSGTTDVYKFTIVSKWSPLGGQTCPVDPMTSQQTCSTTVVTELTRTDKVLPLAHASSPADRPRIRQVVVA